MGFNQFSYFPRFMVIVGLILGLRACRLGLVVGPSSFSMDLKCCVLTRPNVSPILWPVIGFCNCYNHWCKKCIFFCNFDEFHYIITTSCCTC